MGRELLINGEPEQHGSGKSIQQLKEDANIPIDHILRWQKDGDSGTLSNNDTVGDIPDGSNVLSQPNKGRLFG